MYPLSAAPLIIPMQFWDILSIKCRDEISAKLKELAINPNALSFKLNLVKNESLHNLRNVNVFLEEYQRYTIHNEELQELRKLKSSIDNIKEILK